MDAAIRQDESTGPTLDDISEASFYQDGENLNTANVATALAATAQQVGNNIAAVDTMFILVSGYLVFFMQAGFAMLTAGSVRSKNTKNVLIKNVFDACVGAFAYFIFGYAFAYGSDDDNRASSFIGHGAYALSNVNGELFRDFPSFFFQWAFAATAATIVSGSVAERTSFYAYLGYAFLLTSFVYPVVSHWVWDANGWLNSRGVIDFAGCSVVHMVGGIAGLVGAIIVGPRIGRFDSDGRVQPLPGHSATLCTLGTFILWFGWYGFNPGSALGISNPQSTIFGDSEDKNLPETAARCAVTTTLAAAAGGVTTLVVIKIRDHIFDLLACLNGILAGLVGITASCAFVEPWSALVIGSIAALCYILAAMALLKFKIDDPLEAFPIHGAGGLWGVIAAGLFNRGSFQATAGFDADNSGALMGGGGKLLAVNLLAAGVITLWTAGLIGPFFLIMKVLGLLRISREEEIVGNDVSKHGGTAYPVDPVDQAEKDAAAKIDNLGVDDSFKNGNEPIVHDTTKETPAAVV